MKFGIRKLESWGYHGEVIMMTQFDTIPARDTQTDRQTRYDRYYPRWHSVAQVKTPLSVKMYWLWPSSRNKANMGILSHQTALCHTWNQSLTEVQVSNCDISDRTGLLFYKCYGGSVTEAPNWMQMWRKWTWESQSKMRIYIILHCLNNL